MDEKSQLENYKGLVNFMTFMRWVLIISLGISLMLVVRHSITSYGPILEVRGEYLLFYSITVFCVLLVIEIIITIATSLFKRKIRSTNSKEIQKD